MHLLTDISEESGKTLVASLHSVDLVRSYFPRTIALRNGELQFDLPVQQVTDEMLRRLYDIEGLKDEAQPNLP